MSKVRVVQIDLESDEPLSALVQAALGGEMRIPQRAALPEPSNGTTELPAPRKPRQVKAKAEPEPQHRSAPGGGQSITERVFNALKKKPQSSIELQDLLDLQPAQVYGACNHLKNQKLVESKTDDDGDGTRRWFVIK
jgi:hypothetical protein